MRCTGTSVARVEELTDSPSNKSCEIWLTRSIQLLYNLLGATAQWLIGFSPPPFYPLHLSFGDLRGLIAFRPWG